MAAKKLTPEEWSEYLQLYEQVDLELRKKPWFAEGWETRRNYLNRANPRGVWMQLVRGNWFDGNIHIETWVVNSTLEEGRIPLVFHVETSIPKHGINRNEFTREFLERAGGMIEGWSGYIIKPNNAMEPVSTRVPFTRETFVPALVGEMDRFQVLGDIIDQTIEAVKHEL